MFLLVENDFAFYLNIFLFLVLVLNSSYKTFKFKMFLYMNIVNKINSKCIFVFEKYAKEVKRTTLK